MKPPGKIVGCGSVLCTQCYYGPKDSKGCKMWQKQHPSNPMFESDVK